MDNHQRPRVLLLGAAGQVGWELTRALARLGQVRALDRAGLDLTDLDAVRETARSAAPDVVVNAAAYTHVDRAETELALAYKINGEAPGVLATEAARSGALLVHFSTDYVFDGTAARPYTEDDPPGPRTVYGSTKLAGDKAVMESDAEAYVFRVGWVYGRRGHNFLNTIERLTRDGGTVRVVADQYGAPTWSRAIAEATVLAVGQWLTSRREGRPAPPRGLYHMASSDHTTWHGFASAIAGHIDLPNGMPRPAVLAITTAQYPTLAHRPAWSVLDSRKLRQTFGLALPHWREQLAQCFGSEAYVASG